MSDNELDREETWRRYSKITNRLRYICELTYDLREELPWYVSVVKRLTTLTTPRTGINGDVIEEVARKLIDLQATIQKLKERNREIVQNHNSARFN